MTFKDAYAQSSSGKNGLSSVMKLQKLIRQELAGEMQVRALVLLDQVQMEWGRGTSANHVTPPATMVNGHSDIGPFSSRNNQVVASSNNQSPLVQILKRTADQKWDKERNTTKKKARRGDNNLDEERNKAAALAKENNKEGLLQLFDSLKGYLQNQKELTDAARKWVRDRVQTLVGVLHCIDQCHGGDKTKFFGLPMFPQVKYKCKCHSTSTGRANAI